MKINIIGAGYVGLSLAVLLAKENEVIIYDINRDKIALINNKISPIVDNEIEYYLKNEKLNLIATDDSNKAYSNSDYIIIATPTNYDEDKNFFDTSSVESAIEMSLSLNPNATIIIKSTIPIGFTESQKLKYQTENIIFSPEFLREGKA